MKFLIMIVSFFVSSLAFSQEASELAGSLVSSWPSLGKILAIAVGVQIVLRGLAEGLTRISVYTDNKWDNKAAALLSQASWILGTALGKFGYSTPKLVAEEQAKKLEESDKKE